MHEIELQFKQDENTVNNSAEIRKLVSNTNTLTTEEILHQQIAEDVVNSKVLNVADDKFIQFEKEPDESNQIIKCFEKYIGDDQIKYDLLNNVFESIIKKRKLSEGYNV